MNSSFLMKFFAKIRVEQFFLPFSFFFFNEISLWKENSIKNNIKVFQLLFLLTIISNDPKYRIEFLNVSGRENSNVLPLYFYFERKFCSKVMGKHWRLNFSNSDHICACLHKKSISLRFIVILGQSHK